jgi:DMSO/TMAO reductase YedYZ heme-binding membrane subunit
MVMLPRITHWIITHNKLITRLFIFWEWLNIGLIILLLAVGLQSDTLFPKVIWIGLKYGTLALGLLGITLLPGITKRTGWPRFVTTILMPHRRRLGISMYVATIGHFCLNFGLAVLITKSLSNLEANEVAGIVALLLLTPIFLTSNDWSVKRLRRWWGRLHKLVYLVLIMVLLHLILGGSDESIIAWLILIAEIISYLICWSKKLIQRRGVYHA